MICYVGPAAGSQPNPGPGPTPSLRDVGRPQPRYDRKDPMRAMDIQLTAEQALDECRRRGLVVQSERDLAGRRTD